MAEAGTPSPTLKVHGCSESGGWVPFPKVMSRRHPLTDAVGRTDDPCDRPQHNPPDFTPGPKFKATREGHPNNLCHLEDYANEKLEANSGEEPGSTVNISVAPGTPHEICIQPQPIFQNETFYANPPSIENCCSDARSLDTLRQEVRKVLGPHEEIEMGMKNWAQCQTQCQPLLPKYPCRGVIRSPRPDWPKLSAEQRCKSSMVSTKDAASDESKPLTGREFVEGMKTCDLYPIHPDLPKRFNNSEWFKGYGCEATAHPFYLTTAMDYGRFPPTAHTMTQSYYPRQCQFTNLLMKAGMPRNRSLNLANDKTIV